MKQLLIPKGELENDVIAYLTRAGFDMTFDSDRKLSTSGLLPLQFVLMRASSIPKYVNDARAEKVIGGITGSDILKENRFSTGIRLPMTDYVPTYTPSKLYVGLAKRLLPSTNETPPTLTTLAGYTIGTKYPNLARVFFLGENIPVTIESIPGSDEILPEIMSMAGGVFGLTKTGETARANGIIPVKEVEDCSVNLITRPTQDTETLRLISQLERLLFL